MSFNDKAFHAVQPTVVIAASTASTNVAFSASVGGFTPQVRVTNGSSASLANVTFGSSTVTSSMPTSVASTDGYLVGPFETVVVHPGNATYASATLNSGTGSVYFTPGAGK